MGNSHSHERLKTPLHAQSPGVLATAHGVIVKHFTSLHITHVATWGSAFKITDEHTQQHVFNFAVGSLNVRCTLETPDGRPLLRLKAKKNVLSGYRVCESHESDDVLFEIRVEGSTRLLMYADFQDRLSGRACRVLLDGGLYDSVAVFYLEYGSPDLPPKPRREDVTTTKRFQAVGRIRRPESKAFTAPEYFVEAAPGVDLTVLLLMWRLRKDLVLTRRED